MANLGPSELLLRKFRAGKLSWYGFAQEYKRELYEDGQVDRKNENIKNHGQKFTLRLLQTLAKRGTLTLMCHCDEDEDQCHRHLLADLLHRQI
jgi:uncharacterized protein YeaO (DUF488 family)